MGVLAPLPVQHHHPCTHTTGFKWSTLYDPLPVRYLPTFGDARQYPSVLVPAASLYALILDCIVYCTLLWYFDNVIPDQFGARRPLHFPFIRAYWGLKQAKLVDEVAWLKKNASLAYDPVAEEDANVLAARQAALDPSTPAAVRVINLRKVYLGGGAGRKVAVNNFTLALEEGKLLALLGQNGAGKATTMSMLSGLTPSSQGDATMFGYSVSEDIFEIRQRLGICPQHDVLFDDLTAKEHIELYAGLKGVPFAAVERLLVERLEAVKLTTVKDVRAVTYSGGMKRRLSLVIANN